MIRCGIQCVNCEYPIHFDTYKGCSHACSYCYVKRKYDISDVSPINTTKSLRNFISGGRNFETKWCDWAIPLHWGANSDPFQPCEKVFHKSLDCLEIFAESQYPFIVSTKNPVLLLDEPYFSLIQKCNCVLQVSMACSKYDKIEKGAPSFEERLKAVGTLSKCVKRVVVRIRPYFPDCHKEIVENIPRFADAGIHSVNVAGFISKKKQKGMINYGGSYMFDNDLLYPKFMEIKKVCHDNGIVFHCSESGLGHIGDNYNCCGADGLEGFTPNLFNAYHIALDDAEPVATEAMKAPDTYQPFKCIGQSQAWANKCKGKSFEQLMYELNGEYIKFLKWSKERYKG